MGLYTHKMLSHHDTALLYHTCQYPTNQPTNGTISSMLHIRSLTPAAIAGVLGSLSSLRRHWLVL